MLAPLAGIALTLWLRAGIASAAACPDLDAALETAVQDILAADPDGASTSLAAAEQACGCAFQRPDQIARYLLVRGATAEFLTPGSGVRLLASARAIDGSVWDPRFGEDLRAVWASATVDGRGAMTLDVPAYAGRVDGAGVDAWPVQLPAGWHVVQVMAPDAAMPAFGRAVNLPAGESSVVGTGLPPLEAAVATRRRVASPVGLVAAGALAVVGGGLAVGARVEAARVPEAATLEALDADWNRERGFAIGAYAAWGVASAIGVVSFVLR